MNKMNKTESLKACQLLAEGLPEREIASRLGVSQPTISRIKNAPGNKEIIEKCATELIQKTLTTIISRSVKEINSAATLSEQLINHFQTKLI